MFERYTESARRVLFFARFEASEFGGTAIETEYVLLGLAREWRGLVPRIFEPLGISPSHIRENIESRSVVREKVATSVEMPFSAETRRVLNFSAEEADRLLHKYIGPEHLLCALLREEGCVAATMLTGYGLRLDEVRGQIVEFVREGGGEPASPVATGAFDPNNPVAFIGHIKEMLGHCMSMHPGSNEARCAADRIRRALDELALYYIKRR